MGRNSKITWNPYTPGYFENPYDHLRQCREENPVHIGMQNSWMFFRYEEVSDILRSGEFEVSEINEYFKQKEDYIFSGSGQCPYLSKGTKQWPMYLNGEHHKRVRMAMGKAFNSMPLAQLIKESIEECHLQFASFERLDITDYCAQFIFLVVEKMFGVSNYESLDKIRLYSNLLARSQDLFIPKQVYLDINKQFLWGKKIFSGSPYQEMIESSLEKDDAEEDLYSIMAISLMAAFETSKDNLSLSLYQILRQPDLIDTILSCSTQELNLLIEELFRFSSPLQYTLRINRKPLFVDGMEISENSKLYLCLASANRDPDKFDKPDELVADRNPNDHLSFGGGVHYCLGATIARQELRHCLKPMAQFLKDYQLTSPEPIKWSKQIFMRTAKSIAVELKK